MLKEALTINLGSNERPIKKVIIPIKNVEAYEIKVVMKSPFPDLFPKDAIPGTIIVGWLSDKVFHGRRAPMGIFCMIGVIAGIFVYWKSSSIVSINIALSLIGALIYGPVMLIGVSALDLVPKKASGTAAGFTGLFGYLGGQVLAEAALGAVVDKFSWNGGFLTLMISSVLAIIFLSFTWNVHDNSEDASCESN